MRVDHFAFLVKDMDEAIAFYRNKLGLKFVSRELDEENGEEFTYFELDGGNLELLRIIKPSSENGDIFKKVPPEFRGNSPHLAFAIENIEKYVKLMGEKGVKIINGPFEIKDRVKWFYIADPDMNILEFVEWINKNKN